MDFLKDFGVQPMLLAAQVVNFLILLFILKKLLYGPILKVLAERKKKIEDSLKNAEEIEKRLLQTEEEKEKVLEKASLLDEAKKEIEIMKEEGKAQAESLAAQIIQKGEVEARAQAEALRVEVMGRVADIVGIGMEKVTGKIIDKKQKEIIEKSMRNIS